MRRGFTLVELAVVVVLAGLIAGLALTFSQSTTRVECYTTTKAQLNSIKDAIERFTLKNDRFPIPALRNVGVDDPTYGREANIAALDALANADGSVALYGALPFQALNIPVENASDCWGNKLTYVVTRDLTSSALFLNPATNGALTIKTNNAVTSITGAGYAIISHGEDELGAVKNNYSHATDRKWCTASAELRTQNCDVTNNDFVASAFNNGKDAGANYFDDVIVYRGSPWRSIASTAGAIICCWNDNTYGQLGDGTNASRPAAAAIAVPVGVSGFTSVKAGGQHSCAVADNGQPYCWGRNNTSQVDGAGTVDRNTPHALTLPAGVSSFAAVSAGGANGVADHSCGIGNDGRAYCWGGNSHGQLGDGSVVFGYYPVTMPFGVSSFSRVSTGYWHSCAIGDDGRAYCWGMDSSGQLGDGVAAFMSVVPSPVALPVGVMSFTDVAAGNMSSCGIGNNGWVYCWGRGNEGQLGDGTTTFTVDVPTPVSPVAGVTSFSNITAGGFHSCAIGNNGLAYCWGRNSSGELGDGSTVSKDIPTPIPLPTGVTRFTSISVGIGYTCAVGDNTRLYCWGNATPGLNGVIDVSVGAGHACALVSGSAGGCGWVPPPAIPLNGVCAPGGGCGGTADYGFVVNPPTMPVVQNCVATGQRGMSWTCDGLNGGTMAICNETVVDPTCP